MTDLHKTIVPMWQLVDCAYVLSQSLYMRRLTFLDLGPFPVEPSSVAVIVFATAADHGGFRSPGFSLILGLSQRAGRHFKSAALFSLWVPFADRGQEIGKIGEITLSRFVKTLALIRILRGTHVDLHSIV